MNKSHETSRVGLSYRDDLHVFAILTKNQYRTKSSSIVWNLFINETSYMGLVYQDDVCPTTNLVFTHQRLAHQIKNL